MRERRREKQKGGINWGWSGALFFEALRFACAAVQREKCVSTDSFLRIFKLDVGATLSLPETAGALLTAARRSGPVPLCSALLWQPSKACLTVSSSAKLLSGGRASWTFPAARANGDVCMCVGWYRARLQENKLILWHRQNQILYVLSNVP